MSMLMIFSFPNILFSLTRILFKKKTQSCSNAFILFGCTSVESAVERRKEITVYHKKVLSFILGNKRVCEVLA